MTQQCRLEQDVAAQEQVSSGANHKRISHRCAIELLLLLRHVVSTLCKQNLEPDIESSYGIIALYIVISTRIAKVHHAI